MMHRSSRRAARRTLSLTPLLLPLSWWLAAGLACAAAVGDQVELRATHPSGVPFRQPPATPRRFRGSRPA